MDGRARCKRCLSVYRCGRGFGRGLELRLSFGREIAALGLDGCFDRDGVEGLLARRAFDDGGNHIVGGGDPLRTMRALDFDRHGRGAPLGLLLSISSRKS